MDSIEVKCHNCNQKIYRKYYEIPVEYLGVDKVDYVSKIYCHACVENLFAKDIKTKEDIN